MLKRVILFLKKYADLFRELPVMDELTTELETNLNEIDNLRQLQATDITGLRKQKESFRKSALQKAVVCCHAILVYAKRVGNEVLASEMYYTETDMNKMSDNTLDTVLGVIYKSVLAYQTQLVPYGISPVKVTEFKAAIDVFKTAIGTPKGGAISRKQSTEQLLVLFDDELVIADKVDLMIDTIKFSHPAIYAEYHNNRKVLYYSGSLTLKCEVTDAATGLALEGVLVSFALDGNIVLEKLTSKAGGFTVKTMDEGTYSVTVKRLGYLTQILTVNVLDVELNAIKVALVKESSE